MNVRLRLDDRHTFSISQESIDMILDFYHEHEIKCDTLNLVEVALFCDEKFVPCNVWATNWVGAEYDDDVVRFLNAHDVSDLLQFAKEYVYIKEHEHA